MTIRPGRPTGRPRANGQGGKEERAKWREERKKGKVEAFPRCNKQTRNRCQPRASNPRKGRHEMGNTRDADSRVSGEKRISKRVIGDISDRHLGSTSRFITLFAQSTIQQEAWAWSYRSGQEVYCWNQGVSPCYREASSTTSITREKSRYTDKTREVDRERESETASNR